MKIKNILCLLASVGMLCTISSCKEEAFDEHNALNDSASKNLIETLAAEPMLSKFYEYVKQSGMDSVLSSSKSFTVWAPSNDALAALNTQAPAYLADAANLKAFIRYHIVNLSYPLSTKGDTLRAQTLNGKYRTVVKTRVDDANIIKADKFSHNGVVHIIDLASPVKSSIWEFTHSGIAGTANLLAAMNSLDTAAVTPAGLPGIKRNAAWAAVASAMALETGQYTYFMMQDAAFTQEYNKIQPYYKTTATRKDSTMETLTKTAVLSDVLVTGLYTPDNLPDTLLSVGGTKIPVNKNAIVSSYRASNGIVYVMSSLPYRLQDRVRGFTVQGEAWTSIRDNGKRGNVQNRAKLDSVTGLTYYDVRAYDHATSDFFINYRLTNVNTVKYKVYVRAFAGMPFDDQVGDFTQRYGRPQVTNTNTTVLFTQLISANINNKNRFKEVLLGEFTLERYGVLNWRVLSASSTARNVSTIIVDYMRFEPVLP